MKSLMIKKEVRKPTSVYPRLMVSTGTGYVYLMFNQHEGSRIYAGSSSVLRHFEKLDAKYLVEFEGSITLETD